MYHIVNRAAGGSIEVEVQSSPSHFAAIRDDSGSTEGLLRAHGRRVKTSATRPSSEGRLLLACARRQMAASDLAEAHAAIDSGIDWKFLWTQAERHGLSALLYYQVNRHFPQLIDQVVEQRQKFFGNDIFKLQLAAELLKIIESLQAGGVRALAYKGPSLAAFLYGDVAYREMSDLDILVAQKDLPLVFQIFAELGYKAASPYSAKQEQSRLRSDCEREFISPNNLIVDLHWNITPRHFSQHFSFDPLWERRRMVALGQKFVPTFSAEDTAVVLAVHGGKHMWQRLSWLADFTESMRKNLDWHTLKTSARQARAERMLLLAMCIAQEFLALQIPPEFDFDIGRDSSLQKIAAEISKRWFENTSSESQAGRWLTMLKLADRRWDGIRCAARFAVESGPAEWKAVRLPDSLFGLYPLVRIAALVRAVPSALSRRRLTKS